MIYLGKVSLDECETIKEAFRKKETLTELMTSLFNESEIQNDSVLYKRIVDDLNETNYEIAKWWNDVSKKYQWKYTEKNRWRLEYDSCDVYLF